MSAARRAPLVKRLRRGALGRGRGSEVPCSAGPRVRPARWRAPAQIRRPEYAIGAAPAERDHGNVDGASPDCDGRGAFARCVTLRPADAGAIPLRAAPTAGRRRRADVDIVLAFRSDSQRVRSHPGRLRRMPRDGRTLGSPQALHDLRTCRLLRQFSGAACHEALPLHPASDRPQLRAGRELGLVLRG